MGAASLNGEMWGRDDRAAPEGFGMTNGREVRGSEQRGRVILPFKRGGSIAGAGDMPDDFVGMQPSCITAAFVADQKYGRRISIFRNTDLHSLVERNNGQFIAQVGVPRPNREGESNRDG